MTSTVWTTSPGESLPTSVYQTQTLTDIQVRQRLLHDHSCLPVDVGQRIQILLRQGSLLVRRVHLRSGKPHLRCCSIFYRPYHRSSHCWYWRSWNYFWIVHHRCVECSSVTHAGSSGNHWCELCYCQCYRAAAGGRLYRECLLALVLLQYVFPPCHPNL